MIDIYDNCLTEDIRSDIYLMAITANYQIGWDDSSVFEHRQYPCLHHSMTKESWEQLDLVNEIQKYPLEPKELYKVYTSILPKKKQWLRYIKGDKKMDYPKWVYEIVAKDMQVSMREAVSAVETYTMSTGGQSELADILLKYGIENKEVRKLGLI